MIAMSIYLYTYFDVTWKQCKNSDLMNFGEIYIFLY